MFAPARLGAATFAAALALAGAAVAEAPGDFAAGAREYQIACAGCHGAQGEGNGPYAELLKAGAPALTGLAAAHGGKFPLLDVFMAIDGRSGVRGHGGDMPIWGARFKAEMGEDFGPYGAEIQARARILELVFYLQSIQK